MFSSSLIPLQHRFIEFNLRIITPPLHHHLGILNQFLAVNNQRIPPFRSQEIVQQSQFSVTRFFGIVEFESGDGCGVTVAESVEGGNGFGGGADEEGMVNARVEEELGWDERWVGFVVAWEGEGRDGGGGGGGGREDVVCHVF